LREKSARKRRARGAHSVVSVLRRVRIVGSWMASESFLVGLVAEGAILLILSSRLWLDLKLTPLLRNVSGVDFWISTSLFLHYFAVLGSLN
jgi:hypothetical protein